MTMGVPFGTDTSVGGLYCNQKRAGGQDSFGTVIRLLSFGDFFEKCRLSQHTRCVRKLARMRKLNMHPSADETTNLLKSA